MQDSNQIIYDDICKIVGKLYLESNNEIGRLTSIIFDLNNKYIQETQEKIKIKEELDNSLNHIKLMEEQVKRNK